MDNWIWSFFSCWEYANSPYQMIFNIEIPEIFNLGKDILMASIIYLCKMLLASVFAVLFQNQA